MNLNLFSNRAAGSVEMFLKKNSPTILTGAGIVGFIATTALTIKATAKAVDQIPQISKKVAEVKGEFVDQDDLHKDKQEALVKVYAESSVILLKTYGPALLTGSASIVCLLAAHGMMRKRQASLLAAYTALDAGFKAYRSRVAEKFGEADELKLYRGIKTVKDVDDEGQPCEIGDRDDVLPSPYARFFDAGSVNWSKTPEYNLMFLRGQQDWANDRLRAHGFVFLNEVYESLGLERSQAGQIVGWKQNGNGDGFIDFGLYAIGDEGNRAFVNIIEPVVLLDFNVDGPISI